MLLSVHDQKALFDRACCLAERVGDEAPVSFYKSYLAKAECVLDDWFEASYRIDVLVHGRSWVIDQIIQLIWKQIFPLCTDNISLIAVGGYGRGELHPASDIDILLLLQEDVSLYHDRITAFITFLWDLNLTVAHSVRTLEQCIELASTDLSVMTNLLEARLLCGQTTGYHALQQALIAHPNWNHHRFFQAKSYEKALRHSKFNDSEYNLEPDLKRSPGGLRDVQVILWVTGYYFGEQGSLEKLVSASILTPSEHQALIAGRNFLWQVRWALHKLTHRCEDRLLFDYQRTLSERFAPIGLDVKAAIEHFMQRYYVQVMVLSQLSNLVLQYFDDTVLSKNLPDHIVPINARFHQHNQYLDVTHKNVFAEHPSALMEVFVLLTQHKELLGIRASTIRLIFEYRDGIDASFRACSVNQSLFMQLMRADHGLSTTLMRMAHYGVLSRYIPEFGAIVGQMQHDLYHMYTVDAHTLLVIKRLRNLLREDSQQPFPIVSGIMKRLPKQELLYLAALFHDIAKGRGGNHAEVGATDAMGFCQCHQLNQEDQQLVAWLVHDHLLMSMTAQRRDLSDPEVIQDFADRVGSQQRLDYLYCLTVADINATNPKLWNSWRASLLLTLYGRCKQTLQHGFDYDHSQYHTRKDALNLLKARNVDQTKVHALWHSIGPEYFQYAAAEAIAWHTQAMIGHEGCSEPLVLIEDSTPSHQAETSTQVFVYTPHRHDVFSRIVVFMDRQRLSIHSASIVTADNQYSLHSFVVLQADGQPLGGNKKHCDFIQKRLKQALLQPYVAPRVIRHHISRRLKYFNRPAQVKLSTHITSRRTVIEVFASDFPGLLSKIGQVLFSLKLSISTANIVTLGDRIADVFFVVDEQAQPVATARRCQLIQRNLCQAIDRFTAAESRQRSVAD